MKLKKPSRDQNQERLPCVEILDRQFYPAFDYSWFDPETQSHRPLRSRIAGTKDHEREVVAPFSPHLPDIEVPECEIQVP